MKNALRSWTGNIEAFALKVSEVMREIGRPEEGEPSIRLIRDYMQRDILGDLDRKGREVEFRYEHLLRFIAARVLLSDGWPLSKIQEQLAASSEAALEALVPGLHNPPLRRASRRMKDAPPRQSAAAAAHFHTRAARMSTIQMEMREAQRRLGLPEEDVAKEELTLFALAPWCQLLVQTDRLRRITIEEAEDIGRAATANLLATPAKKGTRQ